MLEDDVDEAFHEAALGARPPRRGNGNRNSISRAVRVGVTPARRATPPTTGSGAVSAACARPRARHRGRAGSRPCRRSSGSISGAHVVARAPRVQRRRLAQRLQRQLLEQRVQEDAGRRAARAARPSSSSAAAARRDLVEHLRRRPVAAVRLLDAAVRGRDRAGPRAPQRRRARVGRDRRDGRRGRGPPGRPAPPCGAERGPPRRRAPSASIRDSVGRRAAGACRARSTQLAQRDG